MKHFNNQNCVIVYGINHSPVFVLLLELTFETRPRFENIAHLLLVESYYGQRLQPTAIALAQMPPQRADDHAGTESLDLLLHA